MANTQGEQARLNTVPQTGITFEQMLEMQRQLIAEMRKPTPEEAEKKAKEEAKLKAEKEAAADLLRNREQSETNRRLSCRHFQMLAGQFKSSFRGQVTTGDGMVHPVCMLCKTEWPGYKATQDEIVNGANLEEANVSAEQLTARHRQSFKGGCGRTACFICYPKQ